MTYTEIIEKLKTIFNNVNEFAEEEILCKVEDYPEAIEAAKVRKEFTDAHVTSYNWDSDNNRKIYEALPNGYKIARLLKMKEFGLEWVEVDQYGGEGKGDRWYSVKYFPEHDIYIRVDGWYQSYNGTEFYNGWDSCKEVRPQQKTITVYES